MWKKNAYVVILELVYHENNDIKSRSFRIAKIVEIGKDDLLVSPKEAWNYNKLIIIPKSSCVMIDESELQISASTTAPKIGDLVCAYTQKFSGATEYDIGHVYEKKVSPGNSIEYLIKTDDKEKWFTLDKILVLEGDNNVKSLKKNK